MLQRSQGVLEETKSLKTKVQLAEQAQRAALNMEQDYEDVVHMLEGEIAKLKTHQSVKVVSHLFVFIKNTTVKVVCGSLFILLINLKIHMIGNLRYVSDNFIFQTEKKIYLFDVCNARSFLL